MGGGMASKSKIIYIPNFEDCLIKRKELFGWEGDIGWEYFTSFREAKRQMVDYWKNVIGGARVNLRCVSRLKIGDCI
jgi:hypothetical protein